MMDVSVGQDMEKWSVDQAAKHLLRRLLDFIPIFIMSEAPTINVRFHSMTSSSFLRLMDHMVIFQACLRNLTRASAISPPSAAQIFDYPPADCRRFPDTDTESYCRQREGWFWNWFWNVSRFSLHRGSSACYHQSQRASLPAKMPKLLNSERRCHMQFAFEVG